MARKYSGTTNSEATVEKKTVRTRKDILEDRRKMIAYIVSGTSLFIGLIFLIVSIGTAVGYSHDIDKIYADAAAKHDEREEWRIKSENPPIEYIDPDIVNPYEAGSSVAKLQNELSEYLWNNLRSGSKKLSQEHMDALAAFRKYFNKNSTSDDLYGTWLSSILEKQAKGPALVGECPYEWEFVTTCSFYGSQVSVTWICHPVDDEEEITAIVQAVYDSSSNMFTDVTFNASYDFNEAR